VESECTPHKPILCAIRVPKIIEVDRHLTKFWQKQFCIFLGHAVVYAYISVCPWMCIQGEKTRRRYHFRHGSIHGLHLCRWYYGFCVIVSNCRSRSTKVVEFWYQSKARMQLTYYCDYLRRETSLRFFTTELCDDKPRNQRSPQSGMQSSTTIYWSWDKKLRPFAFTRNWSQLNNSCPECTTSWLPYFLGQKFAKN